MTFDGSSGATAVSGMRRGPAQRAIAEFLAIHRDRPGRSFGARLFGRSPLDDRSAGWYWEAVGELAVVARLDQLGAGWSVIHGIPGAASAGASEESLIDHLVIGPAGVFSVSTYNHTRQNVWVNRRAFLVDGHRLQHIRRAEEAVGHVERMLEAAVGRHIMATTIIAVIDAGSLQVRDLPRDVFVVPAASLDTWLAAREPELEPACVAELAASAHLDSTWSTTGLSPTGTVETVRERAEFDRIRQEIATARVVRISWAIGVVVLMGTLVSVGILQLVTTSLP